jgi:Cu2+-exporting ATPase
VLVLLAAAACTALAWQLADPSRAVPATLAVLAASCPCALSLAVPAALAAVHGQLAGRGVLLLDGDALERLAAVDTVLLDKTGTLTRGRAQLAGVDAAPGAAAQALAVAAALEAGVPHPLARAFAPHAGETRAAAGVRVHAGAGVEGTIDGAHWRLGSAAFAGVAGDDGRIVLARDGVAVARFTLADPLRGDAPGAVAALHALALDTRLLSGDAAERVADVARATGIAQWRARATPEDKLAAVAALQAEGRRVAMLGDGLNDAAVLARADVGVALASGAALAQVRADVVLADDAPSGLAIAIAEARRTRRVMRQNLAWASVYNVAVVPVAALGFLPPWLAALGMCASSLLVTLNALRLSRPAATPPRAPVAPEALPA